MDAFSDTCVDVCARNAVGTGTLRAEPDAIASIGGDDGTACHLSRLTRFGGLRTGAYEPVGGRAAGTAAQRAIRPVNPAAMTTAQAGTFQAASATKPAAAIAMAVGEVIPSVKTGS